MVHPEIGVAAGNEFFSIAACNQWLSEHLPKAEPRNFLPEPEPEYVSPEERERRVKMLKNTAQVIRETVKAKTVGRPDFSRTQRHNPEALLQTDLMKG